MSTTGFNPIERPPRVISRRKLGRARENFVNGFNREGLIELAKHRIHVPGQMCVSCLSGKHTECKDPDCPCVCSEMF